MCGLYHFHLWSRWVADCTGVLKGLHRHTHRVCFRSLWPWESKQHCRHQCWQGAWARTSDVDQPSVTLSLCCIMPAFFTLVILVMVKYWWILRVAFRKMDIYVYYFIFSSWNNRNFYRPFPTSYGDPFADDWISQWISKICIEEQDPWDFSAILILWIFVTLLFDPLIPA